MASILYRGMVYEEPVPEVIEIAEDIKLSAKSRVVCDSRTEKR